MTMRMPSWRSGGDHAFSHGRFVGHHSSTSQLRASNGSRRRGPPRCYLFPSGQAPTRPGSLPGTLQALEASSSGLPQPFSSPSSHIFDFRDANSSISEWGQGSSAARSRLSGPHPFQVTATAERERHTAAEEGGHVAGQHGFLQANIRDSSSSWGPAITTDENSPNKSVFSTKSTNDPCVRQCGLMQGQESNVQQQTGQSLQAVQCSSCLKGWDVAAKFVKNDAAFMKRKLLTLDSRAKEDVERLRSGVHQWDARARSDASRLDEKARQRLRRLRSFALGVEEAAKLELLEAARQHKDANSALMNELQIADLRARRRYLEDAYTAWQVASQVHQNLARMLQSSPQSSKDDLRLQGTGESGTNTDAPRSTRDKRLFPKDSSLVRTVLGLEEIRRELSQGVASSTASEVITSSEELEFLLAALLDMDEVSEGRGALLLAQQVDSPDIATRQAIVNVLAAAPSLWALGNAGIGALQRLSSDENSAVAKAAKEALEQLWEDFAKQQEQNG